MNDFTKDEHPLKHEDYRPMSEYFEMARQHLENELMRGQRMYAPPLPLYKPKESNDKGENEKDE